MSKMTEMTDDEIGALLASLWPGLESPGTRSAFGHSVAVTLKTGETFFWGDRPIEYAAGAAAGAGAEIRFDVAMHPNEARNLSSRAAKLQSPSSIDFRPTMVPSSPPWGTLVIEDGDSAIEAADVWRGDLFLVSFDPASSEDRSLIGDAFDRDSFTQAATAFFALHRFADGGLTVLQRVAETTIAESLWTGEEVAGRLARETLGHVARLRRSSPIFTTPPKPGEENAADAWREAFAALSLIHI